MRRISPGTVTVGVMAILFGLIAAYVVRNSGGPEPAPPPAPAPPTKSIVVARRNLEQHDRIRESDIQVLRVPASRDVPAGTVSNPMVASGRVTRTTIKAGDIVNENDLYGIGEDIGQPPSAADLIKPGHRALTLEVHNTDINNGLVRAGSYVDIAMTVEGSHPDIGKTLTRTLLEKILIVGVHSSTDPRNRSGAAITVSVTPEQANTLINAKQNCQLAVSMVSPNENDLDAPGSKAEVTWDQIVGLRALPPPPVEPKPAPTPNYVVQKYVGGKMVEVVLPYNRVIEAQKADAAFASQKKKARSTGFERQPGTSDEPATEAEKENTTNEDVFEGLFD